MIYLETFSELETAQARYRQLKNWHREWKWNLIMSGNPKLRELVVVETHEDECELGQTNLTYTLAQSKISASRGQMLNQVQHPSQN
jgi:hypothetical protein